MSHSGFNNLKLLPSLKIHPWIVMLAYLPLLLGFGYYLVFSIT
jgi:hypothetical protein